MNEISLQKLLEEVADGSTGIDQAMRRLRSLPFEDLGFARIDHHRSLRQGYPETIFGQGKTTEQTLAIAERILASGSPLLATRVEEDTGRALESRLAGAEWDPEARTVVAQPEGAAPVVPKGLVLVVSAGTSDVPVAREAVITARAMGAKVETLFDVGVAGIHRLLTHTDRLREAQAIVVAAGMEGALASVVGGLVDAPVIAVPTSVGYGASFQGLAALLTMLNSCASGVLVVNIDNGYGAGYAAALINNRSVGDAPA